eukprot:gene46012-biopygen93921
MGGVVYPFGKRDQAQPFRAAFDAEQASRHINLKEVMGFQRGVHSLDWLLRHGTWARPEGAIRVAGRVDNTVLLFSARGGSRSLEVMQEIGELHLGALQRGIVLTSLQYVPSALHQPADELSRVRDPDGWHLTDAAFLRILAVLRGL